MQPWTDEQRKHLTEARELAKGLRNDILEMTDYDLHKSGVLPLHQFLMGIIFDQAVENINNKLMQS